MLENPDFEQKYWRRTAKGIYRIRHDSIRIMKWIWYYDRSSFENINYYDLMASIVKGVKKNICFYYYASV